MEEENQVFGKNAEADDSNINLESEDYEFYHQNKEEAKSNIDNSSKDLSDFIDSLIQDVPAPTDEEINLGIEKILERTHPQEAKNKTSKSKKSKKVTFRVLFVAALLSLISFSCLYVVGSSHNISIENGFVSFAKDTIQVVFFGEGEEKYITVDALLEDLKAHGYEEILFPQEFVNNYDEYKVSVPEYLEEEIKQVTFNIDSTDISYMFCIVENSNNQQGFNYVNLDNAETLSISDIYVYAFQFDNQNSVIEFENNEYRYLLKANLPYSEMLNIAKTIE